MSQTFVTLATQKIEDSDDHINDTHNALRSSFSGTSAPTSPAPVAGQPYYYLTNGVWSLHNGSSFVPQLDAALPYGGLLHRSKSVDYPMTDDLHMGTNQIKNMADGTADTDAATYGQVRDEFIDDHYHSGVDNDGPKVPWYNLGLLGTEAGDSLLELRYGSSELKNRVWAADDEWTEAEIGELDTYSEMASLDCWVWANQLKLIVASFSIRSVSSTGTMTVQLTYQRTGISETEILSRSIAITDGDKISITLPATVRPTGDATHTFRVNAKTAGSAEVYMRYISLVII